MTHGLYRVYLYTVTILLAGFLTGTLANLLGALFGLTPLRGSSGPTDSRTLTQAAILFGVTLLVAGGFGALHYWLVRRDSAGDPTANQSGVRAFLLNLAEAIATLIAINTGVIALEQVGQSFAPDLAYPLAYAVGVGALALALEWERRRLRPTHGTALDFERLRRHGVPLILLFTVLPTVAGAISSTERVIAGQTELTVAVGPWLAALVALGAWLGFLWLGRDDAQSLARQVVLLLGWAGGGMVLLAIALERIAEYVLKLLTPGVDRPDYLSQFDFGPLLAAAAVALAVYGWALRERAGAAMTTPAVRLTMRALAAAILAAPLWAGVFNVLNNLFNAVAPGANPPVASDWDVAGALLIAGAGYIPLALWLGAGSRAWEIKGPRRGFVLALLGVGALVTAGAAATLLFAVVSPVFSVPLDNWQAVARSAGATLITGAALGGLYLFIALREKQFTGAPHAPAEQPVAPAAVPMPVSTSLDDVLSQFKGGALSQDDAAARIRDLARAGALV